MNAGITLEDLTIKYSNRLVESLRCRGVLSSSLVEEAFQSIPRHAFVDKFYTHDPTALGWRLAQPKDAEVLLEAIYTDEALVTAVDDFGQPASSSTAPWLMALMLDALQLSKSLRILEIGTGTGYNAALLAHIVGDPSFVFSIEIIPALAQQAERNIERVVGKGTTVHIGNGLEGYPRDAPYDRIIATGSYHRVPDIWLDQLWDGGILVMNLKGYLAGGILRLEKNGAGRAAQGRFLNTPPSVGFIALEDPPTKEPSPSDHLGRYFNRPMDQKISLSQVVFDPSSLREFAFLFFLQLELPQAHLLWLADISDPAKFAPCLIDDASQTMLVFRPTDQVSEWIVELRGERQIWDRLLEAYQLWLKLERPKITDYTLEVDEVGIQRLRLFRTVAGVPTLSWLL